jgi:hypothetical protein
MSIQLSVAVRNAMLDAIETIANTSAKLLLYTGAPPTNAGTAEGGTLIATFSLASDWAAAASGGSKALSSLPLTVAASGSGTLGHFRLTANDGTTCAMQGTITATGGGGDMTVDNVVVTAGQNINITGFTVTAPGV